LQHPFKHNIFHISVDVLRKSTLRLNPTKKYLFVQAIVYSLTYNYRIKFACFETGAALDAFFKADRVGLFLFARCSLGGADAGAGMAARALFGVNSIRNQGLAHACRALMMLYMRLVLVAEILDGCEHGIGR